MFLEKVNNPQDLKNLSLEELSKLSAEIRQRLVDVVSRTGGHIASSLGAVELTVALHYCLNTPKDKIIWDVGHQSYAHKILTGRNKNFDSLRQFQGLSGFPNKNESIYDPFTTGHSSTAVSLALGLACAREQLTPQEYFRVVAVIGDGSLSGGLCFEGLNNAGHAKKDIVVILNTNEHSIAPNAGAISTYINKVISQPLYTRFRESLDKFVGSRIPKGSRILKIANKFEEGLKGLFIPGILFEELGFRYFGPLDGNDLHVLIPTLKNILSFKGPRILHIITKKGKGYLPAEKEPVRFHGTGPFDIASGKSLSADSTANPTFTEVFSKSLITLAKENKKIVAITAAMPEGTGLDKFRDQYPERFFDVGIAEAHAVCFASGLARAGLRPVVTIYSTFLQRAYDQIVEDVALQGLPVILAVDRAGIVGEDGATHQGVLDINFLRSIPNIVIMAPKDGEELTNMLKFALNQDYPVVIRYPKDRANLVKSVLRDDAISLGKPEILINGSDFVLFALGNMASVGLEALELLRKDGLAGTLVNARFVKPLDAETFINISGSMKYIFTLEDGIIDGGFGSAVAELLNRPVERIGLPCEFIPHGKRQQLMEKYGLTKDGISSIIKNKIKNA